MIESIRCAACDTAYVPDQIEPGVIYTCPCGRPQAGTINFGTAVPQIEQRPITDAPPMSLLSNVISPADHLRLALRCIADADPGPASDQSLAHDMALMAKQALGAGMPRYPLNLGSVTIGMVEQPDGSIKIAP